METGKVFQLSPSSNSGYLLDNAGAEAPQRFSALSALFDSGTIRHLEACGVAAGWHCAEIGAGGGSIASWMATRVGATGRVVATDIDGRFLRGLNHPSLEIWQQDVASDPLPEAAFDLVHARLVLIHVQQREQVVHRMIGALRKGGWLVLEEFDATSLLPDAALSSGETVLKTQKAVHQLMESRGFELRCGRLLLDRLRKNGLADAGAEGRMFMWQAGTPGASLIRANYLQLHDAIVPDYVTEMEFNEDLSRLARPDFMMPSPIMWSIWGRRP